MPEFQGAIDAPGRAMSGDVVNDDLCQVGRPAPPEMLDHHASPRELRLAENPPADVVRHAPGDKRSLRPSEGDGQLLDEAVLW